MKNEIVILHSPQETRAALIENAQIQEILIEREAERGLVGNIYLGKVQRVVPGLQSAFVDIGQDKAGILFQAQCRLQSSGARAEPRGQPLAPIEKTIFAGQTLMLQVMKEPIGNKGARLSMFMSLAGRYLVYLPFEVQIGVSHKIPHVHREALRSRFQRLIETHWLDAPSHLSGQAGGFIIRTNALEASDEELHRDVLYLRTVWHSISQMAQTQAPGSLLYRERGLAERVLRDGSRADTSRIRVDDAKVYQDLQLFARQWLPHLHDKLEYCEPASLLNEAQRIDAAIAAALERRVDLKSGGYLVVDQTEALTTIDVNTGAYVGSHHYEKTVLQTNLEAAQAIARELRLRNIGGIIVVDFIDMQPIEHRALVLESLRKALQNDRVKTMVGEFSQLGLLEMTRKRSSPSLSQMLTQVCTSCHGSGRKKTVRTHAYEILHAIGQQVQSARAASTEQAQPLRVLCSPEVAQALSDDEKGFVQALSERIARPILVQAQAHLDSEDYELIL